MNDAGTVDAARAALLADLVRRIAADADRAAFTQLFRLLAPKIKSYMKRLGADDAAAEDLAQDVMVTIWRRAGDFDPARASVTTWVYTIARNRRIDRLRRERRPEPDPSDPMMAGGAEPQADQLIDLAEQEARLRVAISELPPEQAELVRLAFYSDKTHTEISAERGLPLGTVKSRVRLALARLRKAFVGDEEAEGKRQ